MSNRERFVSSRINNRLGCGECNDQLIDPYPCCEPQLFETIEYPYLSQNYDLMKETHDWGADQFKPKLLLPQLKQYKKLSGRDDCYIHTLNRRSTLYGGECPELNCDPPIKQSVDKEKFSNAIIEHRENIRNNTFYGYYTDNQQYYGDELYLPYTPELEYEPSTYDSAELRCRLPCHRSFN